MDITSLIGSVAAFCTTVSYFPQLKKCWATGQAGDLSFKMFSILAAGVTLWAIYGILKQDYVIVVANAVSLLLLLGILYFKVRGQRLRPADEQSRHEQGAADLHFGRKFESNT
jgi:MtN3 and saliva related transmembrane protein